MDLHARKLVSGRLLRQPRTRSTVRSGGIPGIGNGWGCGTGLLACCTLEQEPDAAQVSAIGKDIAEGLVRGYPVSRVALDERTDYGQVLRVVLALTIDALGLQWWQSVVLLDWRLSESQDFLTLQPQAHVMIVPPGSEICSAAIGRVS